MNMMQVSMGKRGDPKKKSSKSREFPSYHLQVPVPVTITEDATRLGDTQVPTPHSEAEPSTVHRSSMDTDDTQLEQPSSTGSNMPVLEPSMLW